MRPTILIFIAVVMIMNLTFLAKIGQCCSVSLRRQPLNHGKTKIMTLVSKRSVMVDKIMPIVIVPKK